MWDAKNRQWTTPSAEVVDASMSAGFYEVSAGGFPSIEPENNPQEVCVFLFGCTTVFDRAPSTHIDPVTVREIPLVAAAEVCTAEANAASPAPPSLNPAGTAGIIALFKDIIDGKSPNSGPTTFVVTYQITNGPAAMKWTGVYKACMASYGHPETSTDPSFYQ